MENRLYYSYSSYLLNKYKEKVYKLPIKLPLTCPNRDGNLGYGGCSYCGEEGGSFENLSTRFSVKEQIEKNKLTISKKYNANKFIAFFQNYSNTYLPFEQFKHYIEQALSEDIVEISISTRPDCINDKYLQFLVDLQYNRGIDITIELGLQTVNYRTLNRINRGHSLAEFIEAAVAIKAKGLRLCAHMILNLPWDDRLDAVEAAKILSALRVDEVKMHSLYIMKNTDLAKQYLNNEFKLCSKEEYIERVIVFLEYLNPEIVIQRFIGRAPKEGSVFVNWQESWWSIRDEILLTMQQRDTYQGREYNYLGGKALKIFN